MAAKAPLDISESKTSTKDTPLRTAHTHGYNKIVAYLVEHGARVGFHRSRMTVEDRAEKTAMNYACENGYRYAETLAGGEHWQMCRVARDRKAVKVFLKWGFNVEASHINGACERGQTELAELLLRHVKRFSCSDR